MLIGRCGSARCRLPSRHGDHGPVRHPTALPHRLPHGVHRAQSSALPGAEPCVRHVARAGECTHFSCCCSAPPKARMGPRGGSADALRMSDAGLGAIGLREGALGVAGPGAERSRASGRWWRSRCPRRPRCPRFAAGRPQDARRREARAPRAHRALRGGGRSRAGERGVEEVPADHPDGQAPADAPQHDVRSSPADAGKIES